MSCRSGILHRLSAALASADFPSALVPVLLQRLCSPPLRSLRRFSPLSGSPASSFGRLSSSSRLMAPSFWPSMSFRFTSSSFSSSSPCCVFSPLLTVSCWGTLFLWVLRHFHHLRSSSHLPAPPSSPSPSLVFFASSAGSSLLFTSIVADHHSDCAVLPLPSLFLASAANSSIFIISAPGLGLSVPSSIHPLLPCHHLALPSSCLDANCLCLSPALTVFFP